MHARPAREAGRLHLLGLVSKGGVHAGFEHLRALIQLGRGAGRAATSCCTRSPTGATRCPTRARATSRRREGWLRETGRGRVATVSGRYYAMDRDKRWDRTKLAYDAIVHGRGGRARRRRAAARRVRAAYERDETDEFIKPTIVGEEGRIRDGDAVLFFNFRPDRARQLTRALGEPGFDEFDRGDAPRSSSRR